MKTKTLFIAGNPQSINLRNFQELVGGYFAKTYISPETNYGARHFFSALSCTRRALKAAKPDLIVLYQLNLTAFITILADHGHAKRLAVGVGSDVLVMPRRNMVLRCILRFILRRSDYYNAGSDYLAEAMRRYAPKNCEILVANLGIDPVKATEKENIVYSNRLHGSLYRVDKIIRGFARFCSKPDRADWRLVVAGSGREKEFKELALQLGIGEKTEITGWLSPEENAARYAKSRIYVSIPTSDGVPASLMEAVSADCIAVLSDIAAYKSLCESGLRAVVASDESLEKEDFIEKALSGDCAEMIEQNRRFVAEFSDRERNRRKFYRLFERIFSK